MSIFGGVMNKMSFLSLLAVGTGLVSAGCAQPQNISQNAPQRKYYHDRSVGLGTNVPRTYSDAASADAPGGSMSATNALELDQMQRTSGNQAGGLGGGGAH